LREAILACEGYDRDRDLVCAATDDFNGKPRGERTVDECAQQDDDG
jgi:hypothetical protein